MDVILMSGDPSHVCQADLHDTLAGASRMRSGEELSITLPTVRGGGRTRGRGSRRLI